MAPWTSGTFNPFTFLLMIYTSGVQVRLALKKIHGTLLICKNNYDKVLNMSQVFSMPGF